MKKRQPLSPGEAYTEDVNALKRGMKSKKVARRLGPPRAVHNPQSLQTPSQIFEQMGLSFREDDQALDEVWEYGHPVRKRMTYLLGFRKGIFVTGWRATTSSESTE